MGKKGGCFSAVKKAFKPEPKDKKTHQPTTGCFGKLNKRAPVSLLEETALASPSPPPPPPNKDVTLTETENEQNKHAYSVAIATAVAAEAAVAAAAEVVRLTSVTLHSGKPTEEIAAIKIQTAFRGYLARRALQALRGLARLKFLIQGQSVKRQAATSLKYMQTLARVQSQIRARRLRMSEENQALQRQLQQRHEGELDKLRTSVLEDWNDSTQSKEQVEAKLQGRQEAAIRRERALAYAFSHQRTWKKPSQSANPTFMDPDNPHWGWSWLERWMAARPWESQSAVDHSDHASVKSAASRAISHGEITKAYYHRDLNQDKKPSPTGQKSSRTQSRGSPSTPPSIAPSSSSVTGRRKQPSPRGSCLSVDDDLRSVLSVQSDRCRRHSIGGLSLTDDDSFTSSHAVPSYMTPTQSAKARSRLPSPLGSAKPGTPGKASAASAKKRLSFSGSPSGPRSHSSPAKVDSNSVKDIEAHTEDKLINDVSR